MATNKPSPKRDAGGQADKSKGDTTAKADAKGAGKSADKPMKSGGGGKKGKK